MMTGQNDKYRKAQFFKCALQVNPASYIEYRGQPQTLSEEEYNQKLLDAAIETGIEVIGVADHGSVDSVDSIRDLFSQHEIIVFPGFEIASSENIHFVCLFDEEKTTQELERVLGSLELTDPKDGTKPSRLSAEALIDKIDQQGGFLFAAHCTHKNGLLKRRQTNRIWKHKKLLAAQIPGSVEDLKDEENDFYRKVFLNKDSNYRREREMVAINAADVKAPEDLKQDRASCLIKMTKPCFASFKQAFLDAGSRVRLNSDKSENYASTIERVRFTGGYLDGVDIELSEHLNAVIGGRGTGKSTLLECIRFALDLQTSGKVAKAQHDAILKSNLGNERGMVEVVVRSATMHGRKFTVSRKYGNQPVVVDEYGEASPHHPKDLLPNIEFYGQNEIYEMIHNDQDRNLLVERFLEVDHAHLDASIVEVTKSLKDNRTSIEHALRQRDDIEAEVELLPRLTDQARQFQALGIDEKLKAIPKLEKEKQHSERVNADVNRVQDAIGTLRDSLPDTVFLSESNTDGLPHAELLRQQRKTLEDFKAALEQYLVKLEQLVHTISEKLLPVQQQLTEEIRSEEQYLENSFQEIPASQGKTGRQIGMEYQKLLRQIEQIRPKQNALKTRKRQINELYNQRKLLLLEVDQKTSTRARAMQVSIKKLNRKLGRKVHLRLESESNRQILVDFLIACNLEGIGPKRLSWVLDSDFSPSNLATTIRQGEAKLIASLDTTNTMAKALCRLPESKLLELEELIIPDKMDIELNVAHGDQEVVFRPLEELSTGQQCTAVLHLLLLDNQDPLILDQPEDNLDNAFIADRIVAELRKAKLTRQFLFATHNPNIPVFGDAEWIGVFSVKDSKGQILPGQQGAIDMPEVQHLAADILEGGKAAFNQRREKYGF